MAVPVRENWTFRSQPWLKLLTLPVPEIATILLALAYAIYFSAFTVARHRAFMTQSFDLSVYVQMLWNSLNGDLFRVTIQEGRLNYLQHHFAPSMLVFIPIYAAWKDPQVLLVVQSLIVASAAWPIYKLACLNHPDRWRGLLFATLYLLYPALQSANLYDFHEITIAAPLLAWTWYFAQCRLWTGFWIAAILALGFREEVVIFTTGMGLVLALRLPTRRAGLVLVLVSLVWASFLLAVSFFQDTFNMNAALYFQQRFSTGSNPIAAVREYISDPIKLMRIIITPAKMEYLFNLLVPVGFMTIFAWESIFLVVPYIALNMLGSYPLLYSPNLAHYNVLLAPMMVITAEIGSRRLLRTRLFDHRFQPSHRYVALCAFMLMLSLGYQLRLAHLPISPYFKWPQVTGKHRLAENVAAVIPAEASLSIQDNLAPHASQRRNLSIFPDIEGADYIFLDLVVIEDLRRNAVYDLTPYVEAVLGDESYEIVVDQDGLLLLKRKY